MAALPDPILLHEMGYPMIENESKNAAGNLLSVYDSSGGKLRMHPEILGRYRAVRGQHVCPAYETGHLKQFLYAIFDTYAAVVHPLLQEHNCCRTAQEQQHLTS